MGYINASQLIGNIKSVSYIWWFLMNNLSLNIISANQYKGTCPDDYIYDFEKHKFKDKCISDYFSSGCKNIEEFSLLIGVDAKKLTFWYDKAKIEPIFTI